jgi:hypothetical protein
MLEIVTVVVLTMVMCLVFFPGLRLRAVEQVKAASDALIVVLLRASSGFARRLSEGGKEEQKAWRDQRLRSLWGLGARRRRSGPAPSNDPGSDG